MSARLNLASKPFRNRTLPWMIIAVITVASFFGLLYVISESRSLKASADKVASGLDVMRNKEIELLRKKEEINRALAPEQRQLLDSTHALIDRKQFSWSRLFADLESVLPANVRVVRISVKDVYLRGGQTSALLELVVTSKASSDTVTNMVGEMERAGVFQAEVMSQNLPKGAAATGMEWVLSVKYRPRASVPVNPGQPASVAVASSEGGAQ